MTSEVVRTDFAWTETNVTHFARRKEILSKHPEIRSLMVVDHHFKYYVLLVVIFQFFAAYLVSYFDVSWPSLILLTYVVSGTANHSLLLAMHEIVHNMAFGYTKPKTNKLFGIFVNLPVGVPFSIAFRNYHLDHHKYQGHEVCDPEVEAQLFSTSCGKVVWLMGQFFFYGIRPLIMNPKVPDNFEVLNIALQLTFNGVVCCCLGWKSLFYFVFGLLMRTGLHPIAGHFISDHYMLSRNKEGSETFSYYGSLNKITWNVGYHNEHHDFPNIPGSLLPKVREYASEYYNTIPYHTSLVKVLYDFITDSTLGPYAHRKRRAHLYGLESKRKDNTEKNNSPMKRCTNLIWRGQKY